MRIRLSRARSALLLALATGMTLTLAMPASAALPDNPPNDKIVIDVVTANGSGCKPGTAEVNVSPDNTAFTVTYSDYIAQVGPGIPAMEFRKNCQLVLNVNVPQGFTYAIAQADFRGFASLAKGATATQKTSYYFQGDSQTVSGTHHFKGAFEDNWQTTDTVEVGALVFAPCGAKRFFNVNTELRVAKGKPSSTDTSFITMDSTDGSIDTIYHFHWLRCPKK